jgi:hypothetical protein
MKLSEQAVVMHFEPGVAAAHAASIGKLANSIGLPIGTVIELIIQFGPQAVPVVLAVLQAFQGGFSWDKLTQLLVTQGPLVWKIAQAIAAALGFPLPPLPTIPGLPSGS